MDQRITQLLEARSAVLADVAEDESLLVHCDVTGTRQLYELRRASGELRRASGELRPLTDLPEPVGTARYVPGQRRALLEVDRGGDERHQLYLLELDATGPAGSLGELVALTSDHRHGNHLAGVAPDASAVAYLSNRRNGIDFDLWIAPLPEPGALPPKTGDGHRLVYGEGGWCQPSSGFSPDGRLVALQRPGQRPLDDDLLLVDATAGGAEVVLAHPDEGATVGPLAWLGARRFVVASNVGGDFSRLVRVDLAPAPGGAGSAAPMEPAGVRADADLVPVSSHDGSALLVVANDGGASSVSLHDPGSGRHLGVVPLAEAGVVEAVRIPPPQLSPDGLRVYYTLSSPRLAGDVYCFDRTAGETRRLTASPAAIDPAALAEPELHVVESFDGVRVPLFLFRPGSAPAGPHAGPGAGRPPVVVVVHGGPEGQSTLAFNPICQALALRGFAVAVPNVRGSVGYGKRYAALDDTTKRLDSVRDLEAVHSWLGTAGLDPRRAALWGGSYGGYMVLAGLAFQPELWAAGVDIVGISDLVTFLTNTSDYRRAHRELEYGSLERDGEFLKEASPLRRADQMRAPLFVIHGRNDPRVPVGEAEQLIATLLARGVRCELVVYEDEGHGLARLENRLDAYPRAIAFLEEVLAPPR